MSWVSCLAIDLYAKVYMGACGNACIAGPGYDLTLPNGIAHFHQNAGVMTIPGSYASTVVDDNTIAKCTHVTATDYFPVGRCPDAGTSGDSYVYASVKLAILIDRMEPPTIS